MPLERPELPDSARAVFRALAVDGPASRPALSEALGISKVTMSAAIGELESLGLVRSQGMTRGATGRSAVLYTLAPGAGHVLGVEVGATRVRVAAHSLDGLRISTRTEALASHHRQVTTDATAVAIALVETVRAEVGEDYGPLRGVVIAAPTLPKAGPAGRQLLDGVQLLTTELPVPPEVPMSVENNVNCAAVAEHRIGVARDYGTFAYLQIGVKIGVGLIIDGALLRGTHGAAGEVAMVPFPWAPGVRPRRAGLEEYLGSDALMERCAAAWPTGGTPVPKDAVALFDAAAGGDAHARRVVDEHARDIGALVVSVLAVFDPGLIVLGGGVGQNQLVLPEVRRTVQALAWDTEVTAGALGDHATLLGAVHTAIGRALDAIA
ncbi:ROK family protein [Catenulispora acidiphila DSM 44928]|uniref:ROK family protein n=1 Tax=Catenulispora acidiphila (strain DSM 44928 / JCM 14897 / NBRC 102108 / NRRL B-24433 / ID139908) TaxID=479433 RepID=C7PZ80_CATAD|nr:ROK family transcriptional regulator [Catenulispora acidiphila]ACU71537.1 ROK family protein [Catenulispora acidiphila DSM 44928]